MQTLESSQKKTSHTLDHSNRIANSRDTGRKKLARILFFTAAFLALVAGAYGLISSLARDGVPARVGQTIEVAGGLMRVDNAAPEHMAPMQMSKFKASGMNMAAAGMDMAPEGKRRLVVDVTLAGGENGSLSYSPGNFSISGDGLEATAPLRSQLDAGTVPAGSTVSGNMVFQVPEEARGLLLSFKDGQPVALDLKATQPAHSHGDTGQGHSH